MGFKWCLCKFCRTYVFTHQNVVQKGCIPDTILYFIRGPTGETGPRGPRGRRGRDIKRNSPIVMYIDNEIKNLQRLNEEMDGELERLRVTYIFPLIFV